MDGLRAERNDAAHPLDNEDLSDLLGASRRASEESAARLRLPRELFELEELEVFYDARNAVLWTFMRPLGRSSFTPRLLEEFEQWQQLIRAGFDGGRAGMRFLVLGSRTPGVFCYGGDLELFHGMIRSGDREGLVHYGYRCVEILHRNINALGLPILTVGLVQGAALGGGFEALLSFDHLIAEKSATFGLPEVAFGLFPGMGAHALLSRKLGTAMADRLILSNRTYTAQELFDLGLVHQLAEPGEGLALAREFVAGSASHHPGLYGAKRAMRETAPVPLDELKRIVEQWADSALQLHPDDLELMTRLVAAQRRRARAA